MVFLYGWCEHLFVNELPDKYFKTVFFEWLYVLRGSLLQLLIENCDFLNVDIS